MPHPHPHPHHSEAIPHPRCPAPATLRARLAAALVCLACLASLAAHQTARAAELDARRQAILTSMYNPDAVVTEAVHRDFWSGFDNDPSDPKLPASMERMAAALKNSLAFERAKVLSYKASIKQRKPVLDPAYEEALQARLAMLRDRNLPPDNVLAQAKEFRESLVPVSQGKPLGAPGGAQVLMTPALLDGLLKNIEAAHVRLERLLNPVWMPPAGG
ncbi:hypothetical protein LJR066_005756 [Acidovorax sp. LjRoot66]|uniref:hypothetical protein n=1 Tax=Acidovorax sp. LjRoot66 TaxID=3342334 RepID=UPI003ED0DF8E